METLAEKLVQVLPSNSQLVWQKMGMIAFFHFGMNTFTDKEWGDGQEEPRLFNPSNLDTDQWCQAIKAAGMKGCILTAKHHDGFCLWDTKYTDHSVMHSPYQKDVVRQLSDSCRKYDLALGLYLSPWDRHEATYGSGEPYNDYFCAQLEELLTDYGPLFEVWFDGACGEGPNGKVQQYDWERIYALIRKCQPEACIAVCGPDVRWCGNEAGTWRDSEWSVVPASLRDNEKIQKNSQQADDAAFRERTIDTSEMDLGSRAVMVKANEWAWYPAEVNTSIRPGWFYHQSEDDKVKPLDWLFDLYEHTVGGNAVLLLNLPPDREGRVQGNDVKRLEELGKKISSFSAIEIREAKADFETVGHEAANAVKKDEAYWKPEDGQEAAQITFYLDEARPFSRVVLGEQIAKSQRIEKFEIWANNSCLYSGTTVGYKKICAFETVCADQVTLRILKSRVAPTIREFELLQ